MVGRHRKFTMDWCLRNILTLCGRLLSLSQIVCCRCTLKVGKLHRIYSQPICILSEYKYTNIHLLHIPYRFNNELFQSTKDTDACGHSQGPEG